MEHARTFTELTFKKLVLRLFVLVITVFYVKGIQLPVPRQHDHAQSLTFRKKVTLAAR